MSRARARFSAQSIWSGKIGARRSSAFTGASGAGTFLPQRRGTPATQRPRAHPAQFRADAGERRFEVAPDVVREGFERRDIDDLRRVFGAAREPLLDEAVDRREKRGERLAGTG